MCVYVLFVRACVCVRVCVRVGVTQVLWRGDVGVLDARCRLFVSNEAAGSGVSLSRLLINLLMRWCFSRLVWPIYTPPTPNPLKSFVKGSVDLAVIFTCTYLFLCQEIAALNYITQCQDFSAWGERKFWKWHESRASFP